MEVDSQKVNCKCFGTKHQVRSNCISCGRIYCDKYNIHICIECGKELLNPRNAQDVEKLNFDEATICAYQLKDKLLLFDKENTKRTHVHDAQEDYYDSYQWLSDSEIKEIEEKQRRKREKLLSKRKKKINIRLDITGKKIIEYYSDSEEDNIDEGTKMEDGSCDMDEQKLDIYENIALEYDTSKAGEVYREMRKKWEEKNSAKLAKSKLSQNRQSTNTRKIFQKVQYEDI